MFNYLFILLAETSSHPWWLTAITGSGGALVVLMISVKYLAERVKEKDKELLEVSKDSITCITKMIEKQEAGVEWKARVETLILENNRLLIVGAGQHEILIKKTKELEDYLESGELEEQ